MKTLFFIFPATLLLAGCISPAPHQETITEQWQRESQESERRAKADLAQKDQERTDYIVSHSELKPVVREAILNRKVIIGMTEEQALKSLGGGHNFHSVETAGGKADEWTYQEMRLIFVNGVLTEILQ
jgi:hypothetical protein